MMGPEEGGLNQQGTQDGIREGQFYCKNFLPMLRPNHPMSPNVEERFKQVLVKFPSPPSPVGPSRTFFLVACDEPSVLMERHQ